MSDSSMEVVWSIGVLGLGSQPAECRSQPQPHTGVQKFPGTTAELVWCWGCDQWLTDCQFQPPIWGWFKILVWCRAGTTSESLTNSSVVLGLDWHSDDFQFQPWDCTEISNQLQFSPGARTDNHLTVGVSPSNLELISDTCAVLGLGCSFLALGPQLIILSPWSSLT